MLMSSDKEFTTPLRGLIAVMPGMPRLCTCRWEGKENRIHAARIRTQYQPNSTTDSSLNYESVVSAGSDLPRNGPSISVFSQSQFY